MVAIALGLSLAAVASSTSSGAAGTATSSTLATVPRLERPAGMVIAPNGVLFIADEQLNQVIARLADGKLLVVAGTGTAGDGGDGGLATDAQLSAPDGLARASDGALYVTDEDSNRVREILLNDKIATFAGDGSKKTGAALAVGTPAARVALSPSAVAVGSGGTVYVASENEIVMVSPVGLISGVVNLATTPGVKLRYGSCDPQALATASGNLFIGCANSEQLIERLASGRYVMIQRLYRPHDYPGIALEAGGAVLIANHESLLGLIDGKSIDLIKLDTFGKKTLVVPSGVAVSANGTIFIDSQYGDGFTSGSALAKVTPAGAPVLLNYWKMS